MKTIRDSATIRVMPLQVILALLVAMLLFIPLVRAQPAKRPKRVMVLYWYNKDYPGNILFDESFQAVLKTAPVGSVEYYPEYLESNRFPGEAQAKLLRNYLRQKYADRPIDVVVANTDASLDFLFKNRDDFFPHTPLVFLAAKRPTVDQVSADGGLTGLVPASTHRQTVDLALRLHPGTQEVFVVSGALEHDRRFETIARKELQGYDNKIIINYLTDLPLPELIAKTKILPKHSVILYVWQQSLDEKGQLLETYDTLARFAPSASAPIYGMATGNLGRGIIGGYLSSSEAIGTRSAQIVLDILKGKRPQEIPIENTPNVLMFDWRELRHWGISERSLPPGSIIRFRQYTFWQQYRWRIIGVVTLMVLQTSFIAVLLVEGKRRRRAKEALAQLNAELEQRIVARTAALNAKSRELETFAYSVAHDLKAPLRGIDGYSRLLLEDHAAALDDEGRSFLDTIQSSTEEMTQLIDDLLAYSRLERRDFKPDRLELQPLIATVVEKKKREETDRSIDFVVDVNGGSVLADRNGLTQSLSNYLDNAVKFTRNVSQPRVEIGAKEMPGNYLLWVRDNGIGFDSKYQERIFDIFQRLNPSEDYPGTGVGLAIVRKAMERMGGRAWAESELGRGATFYLEIPKSTGERLIHERQPKSDPAR